MNIPTAHSTESLVRFLQHIEHVPAPELVTPSYLKEAGFVSSHDRELLHIFRLLGFLDEKGKPLRRWGEYKEHGDEILQTAIHECYLSLFELYPDNPFSRSDEALRLWFRPPITSDSESSIIRAVRTFRKLCQLAGMVPPDLKRDAAPEPQPREQLAIKLGPTISTKPQLVFQISTLADRSQYVEFLAALKEVFYE